MLEDIRSNYVLCANAYVKNWETADKNDLINKCISYEDTPYIRDGYFAAVVLRYWGNIGRYYNSSKASGFTIEDCYDMLIHAITYILEKRKWLDPNNPYFNDPTAPDKMLNRAIYSTRQLWYYLANRDKRRANFGSTSLDKVEDDVHDHNKFLEDNYSLEKFDSGNDTADFQKLVSFYFNNNQTLSALVLHSIYFTDCFNHSTKTIVDNNVKHRENNCIFKLNKLITNMLAYNADDVQRISVSYETSFDKVSKALNDLKESSKAKTTKIIKSVLQDLQDDELLRGFLCY